jgi:uncharacterized protein DUF4071
MKPYCFVLMPFGKKSDESGRVVDFDLVYQDIIKPAVIDADLDPIRADEEIIGGIIHKPMFERLMMCDYAVADLTTANANVFYELGIRHGVRPHSTVLIAGRGMRLPFDVAPLRAIFYEIDRLGLPANAREVRKQLAERLQECRDPSDDSPLYQLLTDVPRPDIQRLKTDSFRDVIKYSQKMKNRLRDARKKGPERVAEVEEEISVVDADPAIVVDLYLSYRAVKDWSAMVSLVEKMSPPLKQTIFVQEQLGFALNRLERHADAEHVLTELISNHGLSSETNGILGRVYKDQWAKAKAAGNPAAVGYLRKAINTYLEGFEADWRDAYPGINAVTMMEMTDPPDSRQQKLVPLVTYAVRRRLESKNPDYWDYATLLELSILSRDKPLAIEHMESSLAAVREQWEPETTARNLKMIREARASRGEVVDWIQIIEDNLNAAISH